MPEGNEHVRMLEYSFPFSEKNLVFRMPDVIYKYFHVASYLPQYPQRINRNHYALDSQVARLTPDNTVINKSKHIGY